MSNAKRFLSVILAMIMVLSTLVVGASAAYNGYKDEYITDYDALDKPHLTVDQYATAAMDEVDRMLKEEQLILEVYVLTLDITTLDKAMDSLYNIKKSSAWSLVEGMIGDLKNIDLSAFATEADGGVRRGTPGKSEVEIIYAIFEFLYDNRGLLADFVRGDLDMGTLIPSFVDLSDFSDISKLLKGLLYKVAYKAEDENGEEIEIEVPENIGTYKVDDMVQQLIDRKVVEEVPGLEGYTNISTGSMYDFIDNALKICYNELLVPFLNGQTKNSIKEALGVVIEYDDEDNIISEDRTNLRYGELINIDYEVPTYTFTEATFISQLNDIAKSILDEMIFPNIFVWASGDNSTVMTNITNLAKAALVNTGDDFFPENVEVATPEEVEAMTSEELVVYALRAIINGAAENMYIPECTSIREFGYYALKQLCATSIPELDFSGLDKNSTESIFIMAMNFAIYSTNSEIDLGLDYAYDVAGIDAQVDNAMDYAIENYAGVLSGITFDTDATGWDNFNTLIFSIIPASWLPVEANDDVKTFLMDCLIDNIFNLDFDAIFNLFNERADSELQSTPKQVIINLVTRIINIIFPNAFASATSLDQLFTNEALANTVSTLFYDLYTYRAALAAAILPTACDILELTSLQEFEYPEYTYEELYVDGSGSVQFDIEIRNGSTGINSGYTDVNGDFHQDSLYTYKFRSITPKLNGTATTAIKASVPGDLAGGQYGTVKVDGSLSSAGALLSLDITYDVLTELGTPLTDTPITETLYVYLTKTVSDAVTTTSPKNGNVTIEDANTYLYFTNLDDLFDYEITVLNYSTSEQTVSATSTYGSTAALSFLDADNNNYIQVNTETETAMGAVTDDEGNVYPGEVSINVFEPTEAYKLLTDEEKAAAYESIITAFPQSNRYYPNRKVSMGAKAGGTTASKDATIFLYKDYGLPGIVEDELTAHRQQADYGATEWTKYTQAMAAAVEAIYKPFVNSTFKNRRDTSKAYNIEVAYPKLVEAIEALEASAVSAGVQVLQDIINQYNPSVSDGVEYDDPNYVFFGVSDYVPYTYYNYRDEYRTASDLIDSATIPDANGNVKIVDSLELAYVKHRLSLYGSRLLPVDTVKTHLAAELANPTRAIGAQADYTEDSWANYQRALTFAQSVNNEAAEALRQSKVNAALENLLDAERLLVVSGGDTPADDATYTPVSPVDGSALQVVETSMGKILLGIFPADEYAIEDYFNCTGCYVEVVENGEGVVSTGAVVNIKDSATDEILDSYIICVAADVNEDGITGDPYDLSLVSSKVSLLVDFDELIVLAADLTDDNDIDVIDVSHHTSLVGLLAKVDYANRSIVVL